MILFLIAFTLLLPTIVVSYLHICYLGNQKGYWRQLAIDIDIFGNRAFRTLWNSFLITEQGYQFGEWGETISSALGKNQRDNTLKPLGKSLANLLDWIDPNHSIKAIKD